MKALKLENVPSLHVPRVGRLLSLRASLVLVVSVLAALIALLFVEPRMFFEVSPEKVPIEKRPFRDSFGLPYKSRGLF